MRAAPKRLSLSQQHPNSSATAVGSHDHDVYRGNARTILATTGARATDANANTTFDRRRCNRRSASIARGFSAAGWVLVRIPVGNSVADGDRDAIGASHVQCVMRLSTDSLGLQGAVGAAERPIFAAVEPGSYPIRHG